MKGKDQSASFGDDPFRRKNPRRTEKTWLNVSLLLLVWGRGARFRLLCRRSDRLLCIRRIATPSSSVEKSKPRCMDLTPVDMSVLLAVRKSPECLGRTDVRLSVRDVLRETNDEDLANALRAPPN
jgi:hypothetical protein